MDDIGIPTSESNPLLASGGLICQIHRRRKTTLKPHALYRSCFEATVYLLPRILVKLPDLLPLVLLQIYRGMTANAYQAVLAQAVVGIGSGPWPALGVSPVNLELIKPLISSRVDFKMFQPKTTKGSCPKWFIIGVYIMHIRLYSPRLLWGSVPGHGPPWGSPR
jgi:hypothetical protein